LSGAYWANAVSFLPVILVLALMHTGGGVPALRRSMAMAMIEGFRYARKQRLIFSLLGLEAVNGICSSPQPLMAVFARDVLHVGAQGLGVLLSMLGIGALVGTGLLVTAGSVLVRGRFILLATILNPAALIAFALSHSYSLSLGLLMIVGLLDMVGGALRNTAIQLDVEESYRGRTMGLLSIASRGVSPLGGVQAGALASLLTAPIAVAIGGLVTIGWSLTTAMRVPEIKAFDERDLHLAGAHRVVVT